MTDKQPITSAEDERHTDDPKPAPPQPTIQKVEDLTLAAALGRMLDAPRETVAAIHRVAQSSRHTPIAIPGETQAVSRPLPADLPAASTPQADESPRRVIQPQAIDNTFAIGAGRFGRTREAGVLLMRLLAFALAVAGNTLLSTVARTGNFGGVVTQGSLLVGSAVVVWLASEILERVGRDPVSADAEPVPRASPSQTGDFTWLHPFRIGLAVMGAIGIFVTFFFTDNNLFTWLGFFAWMLSIVAVSLSLATDDFLFGGSWRRWRLPRLWRSPTFYALVVIVLIGAYFRLAYLPQTPPQMTSDHVEKLLDAQRVLEGNTQVFFPNNGGREPLQMYLMALLSQVPGLSMDFTTLKLLSALEGIVTLPVLWWLGRELVGEDTPRLANIVGLTLALLVAVSHWHVALSRLALRIVLTPLITALMLIYLGRGLRTNNRDDWLRAGLALGAGLYMYQAVRMLPVVVIVGTIIALIVCARRWGDVGRYAVNFTSLVIVSFVTFVPMFVFSSQFSDLYWRRTTGRLLGDSVVEVVADDGSITERNATVAERFEVFQDNLPVLGDNIQNVLLMFNWKGDVAWINNAPNYPQMDALVGGLFLMGLAAWLVRMFTRRGVIDWLVPMALFLMLLPSALSIAYPVENPSATRTSGALPLAYLLAAYPLALIFRSLVRLAGRAGVLLGVLLIGGVALGSYLQNTETYFEEYHQNYLLSSLPYRQAGAQIEAFNQQVGGQGNTFMLDHPFWWDHRALGIAGGMIDYPNGVVETIPVPDFLSESYNRNGEYRLNPDRDLLFFHAADDLEAREQLQDWFPQGRSDIIEIAQQRRSYATYRVPAIGEERFLAFIEQQTQPDSENTDES